jgi:hypothetical protein
LFRGIKRLGRLGVRLGVVVGLFALINQLLRRGSEQEGDSSAPAPTPTTRASTATADDPQPEPQATLPAATTEVSAWVQPEEGACPITHPVKAKVSSKIFHEPGMTAYDRTSPDRCYRDATTAEADGFRRAKR